MRRRSEWETANTSRGWNGIVLPHSMRLSRMLQAVDLHAAGEPGRVIVGGVADVPGRTMFEKMTWLQTNDDSLRLRMLREPRGYPAANCNLILPPTHPEAQAGYVIMEQVEYPGMSGTNTICVVTALLETGMIAMQEPVTELTLESPAGLICVRAECAGGKVRSVTFRNVPAFATHLDTPIEVPQVGTVVVDVAYGGMFYVIADAVRLGFRLTPDEGADLTRVTEMIKAAAAEQLPVVHPEQPGFAGITIGQLSGPAHDASNSARNVVTVSTGTLDWSKPSTWTGVVDRSPCGTGTSAKMAILHAKGELKLGAEFRHEGILGTVFTGRLVEETTVGVGAAGRTAVVPTITGTAWITGFASYVLDPEDPFPSGYTLGDIW
jgi:proline racemase